MMPSAEALSLAAQFGLAGVIALAAGTLIWYVIKFYEARMDKIEERHQTERKEFADLIGKQHADAMTMGEKFTAAHERNTAVMSELRTIIHATHK